MRPDFRKPLYPNIDAIKPKAPGVKINKEHEMTDYEIDKLFEQIKGPGPTSFHPNNRLTEKRADIGVPRF